jgi:hypothetical protein
MFHYQTGVCPQWSWDVSLTNKYTANLDDFLSFVHKSHLSFSNHAYVAPIWKLSLNFSVGFSRRVAPCLSEVM